MSVWTTEEYACPALKENCTHENPVLTLSKGKLLLEEKKNEKLQNSEGFNNTMHAAFL